MHEPGLVVVVVLRADAPAAAGHRQGDHRESKLAAGDEAQLAGAIHQLVHRVAQEGGEEQVDHRSQPGGGGAGRRTGNDAFSQRRVAYPRRAEFIDELVALGGDAFTENEYRRIVAHFLGKGGADRCKGSQGWHGRRLRHKHRWSSRPARARVRPRQKPGRRRCIRAPVVRAPLPLREASGRCR